MKLKTGSLTTLLTVWFLLLFFFVTTSPAAPPTNCEELLMNKCLSCHYETRICQKVKKRKGKRSWARTIKSMVRHGAVVNKGEQKTLVNCLSSADQTVLELCGMNK